MEEVANRSRLFTKKSVPGFIVALLASAGQLVAPSGPLFEVLFDTFGRYWGRPGPELHKDVKIDEKWGPEGKPFQVICHLADSKSDVVFLTVFFNNS